MNKPSITFRILTAPFALIDVIFTAIERRTFKRSYARLSKKVLGR